MARFQLDLISGPESRRAFAELLDRTFKVPERDGFLRDFPIWDENVVPSSEEIVRLGAYLTGGQLVACAGVRMAQLWTPTGSSLTVALIGAVATDEAYRGEGLASGLVSSATEWAKTRRASAVFLWGSEHSLYGRLGFELCGSQVMLPLDSIALAESPDGDAHTGWSPAIFQQMKRRVGGLALTERDEPWIAAHDSVEWFWTGSSQKCDAYLAVGRGIDLGGVIHEWGGEKTALHRLLAWLRSVRPGLILLGSPSILAASFRECGFFTGHLAPEYLCMARVLDPEQVIKAFRPESTFGTGTELLTSAETARLLFGPLSKDAPTHGQPWAPLPLWFWGLDAV